MAIAWGDPVSQGAYAFARLGIAIEKRLVTIVALGTICTCVSCVAYANLVACLLRLVAQAPPIAER